MELDFIGIDPETDKSGSPTVWVAPGSWDIVVQSETADEPLIAEIGGRSWVPGHEAGVPSHESVIRIPARMVPLLRKACDEAERGAAGA